MILGRYNKMLILFPSFLHSRLITGFFNKSNATDVTSRADTPYPSGVPEFIPVFNEVCVV